MYQSKIFTHEDNADGIADIEGVSLGDDDGFVVDIVLPPVPMGLVVGDTDGLEVGAVGLAVGGSYISIPKSMY